MMDLKRNFAINTSIIMRFQTTAVLVVESTKERMPAAQIMLQDRQLRGRFTVKFENHVGSESEGAVEEQKLKQRMAMRILAVAAWELSNVRNKAIKHQSRGRRRNPPGKMVKMQQAWALETILMTMALSEIVRKKVSGARLRLALSRNT